jgi:hypothetical protein
MEELEKALKVYLAARQAARQAALAALNAYRAAREPLIIAYVAARWPGKSVQYSYGDEGTYSISSPDLSPQDLESIYAFIIEQERGYDD